MPINPLIALAGEKLDTATPIQNAAKMKMDQERFDMDKANAKIEGFSAREKARIESVVNGAAELDTYLESGDLKGAETWALGRKKRLGEQIAAGMDVDTAETDGVLSVLRSGDPEALKTLTGQTKQLIKLGQHNGMLKAPSSEGFSLSPGQTRYDAAGNAIASAPKPEGMVAVVDPETGETTYQPSRKLSATDTKEIYEASDVIQSGEGAKDALARALTLMRGGPDGKEAKPYSGVGAGARAYAARVPLVGDVVADPKRGAATTEYTTLVTEQALGSLKSIFGGMPTEGERKILLDMQAIAEYTPEEQERIINNALTAIERREGFNKQKIQSIQTGDYGALGKTGGTQKAASGADNNDPLGLR